MDGWLWAEERWEREAAVGLACLVWLQSAPRRARGKAEREVARVTMQGDWHVRAPKGTLWTPPDGGIRLAA